MLAVAGIYVHAVAIGCRHRKIWGNTFAILKDVLMAFKVDG